jgi:SAM-dependent methyltransferase
LAATFDQAAQLYQHARPEYPDGLYERLLTVTGLAGGAHLLEVGCATGKATLSLARRGFHITCVEPGPRLAAEARGNAVGLPVEVVEGRFEEVTLPERRFAMVYAATAWQWVNPEARYRLAADVLEHSGYLAFWDAAHVFPFGGDPFFEEVQDVYDEIGESLPPGASLPRPGQLPDQRRDIEASGLFEVVDIAQFDWETVYDAEGYIALLNTFSGHIAMQGWQRERLYGEIRRRLGERNDGLVRRHWGAVLHVARRIGPDGGNAAVSPTGRDRPTSDGR